MGSEYRRGCQRHPGRLRRGRRSRDSRPTSRNPSRSRRSGARRSARQEPAQNRIERRVEVGFISALASLGRLARRAGPSPSAASGAGSASPRAGRCAARGRPCRRAGGAGGSSSALAGGLAAPGSSSGSSSGVIIAQVEGSLRAVVPHQHLLGQGDIAAEQGADRLAAVDPADRLADERRDREAS